MTPSAVAALAAGCAVVVTGSALRPTPAARLTGRARRRRAASGRGRSARWIVALAAAAALVGPVPAVLLAASVAAARRFHARRRVAAEQRAVDEAMPDATEVLVACLHAGRSPTQAVLELARLAPAAVRPAFAAVEQRLHRGHGLADALDELTARCGGCALPLVAAIGAAVRDGLPLAPVLDRLTDQATASRRRHGEAAARRLPVRLSFPLVLCTLPSFVLLSVAPAILGAVSSLRDSPL